MRQTLKKRLMPIVSKLQPAARVAERVAMMAVHLQKPTTLGILGAASTGLSALADQLGQSTAPGWSIDMLVSSGQIVEAITNLGASVRATRYPDGRNFFDCVYAGQMFCVDWQGTITFQSAPERELLEWMRQALDRALPRAIDVRKKHDDRGTYTDSQPIALTRHDNPQAAAIAEATLPLLGDGRCILLDGKPGVGKTTLAQIIARDSGLGRVVVLASDVVGARSEDGNQRAFAHNSNLREGLRMLSPGVVIVDDVDKVFMPLDHLEAIRAASRLVILTANNGDFDGVLDGAMMRAGRVDEVFTIQPVEQERVAPFDKLLDEDWAEVSQWPVAYVNEVRARLQHRPHDVRLDDLRQRLTRKTRSGDVLR